MPISNTGWEILIVRKSTQKRASDGKVRTIGLYQVFHDGAPVAELSGMTAESRGPSSNETKGVRIKPGRYPLATQAGGKYSTLNYTSNENQAAIRKPGIELLKTGDRSEILIHPGIGFLASIGCINLCKDLPDASEPISYGGSRRRVIALIDDMKQFLSGFPAADGEPIPNAFAVIEDNL
ncbi:hypothetical protein FHS96_000813 [Sphingomonas zeicaulis]|uniref:hypothetical protein n=1 Tax=Sphingomonas zeicaulis TaxID=1632740 RepID=UPI003D224B7F